METVKQLALYIRESERAINRLLQEKGIQLSDFDFQIALSKELNYDEHESTRVIEHELHSDKMFELLKEYMPGIDLMKVTFPKSILPEGVLQRLDEQEVRRKGEIWVIHKNDLDPFPSNPHGHNKATGYKLHLGSGELYDYKNGPLHKKIKKKDLLAIRSQLITFTIPPLNV